MGKCETCGNEYENAFEIHIAGDVHVFDCFECAIHALAPICEHCGCRVIGHGVETGMAIYCCAHCANMSGVHDVKDRSASASKHQ
jgi:hypothetical protein